MCQPGFASEEQARHIAAALNAVPELVTALNTMLTTFGTTHTGRADPDNRFQTATDLAREALQAALPLCKDSEGEAIRRSLWLSSLRPGDEVCVNQGGGPDNAIRMAVEKNDGAWLYLVRGKRRTLACAFNGTTVPFGFVVEPIGEESGGLPCCAG